MLWHRVLAALVLAPLAIAIVLFLDTRVFALVLATALLLALWEWLRMVLGGSQTRRLLAMLPYAAVIALLWFLNQPVLLQATAWIGAIWWLLALLWLANYGFASRAGAFSLSIKLMAGALVIIPAWSAGVLIHAGSLGPAWLLWTLLLVWAADVFAYFAGRQFGRAKLAPTISPGKTRAGAWGALAGGVIVALLGSWYFSLSTTQGSLLMALALITVVFSIAGDLFESLIKRHAGFKDSGALIPGHGGILDRLDSICAALPVFFAGRMLVGL